MMTDGTLATTVQTKGREIACLLTRILEDNLVFAQMVVRVDRIKDGFGVQEKVDWHADRIHLRKEDLCAAALL